MGFNLGFKGLMFSSVAPKDEICFLRAYHHIPKAVYLLLTIQ